MIKILVVFLYHIGCVVRWIIKKDRSVQNSVNYLEVNERIEKAQKMDAKGTSTGEMKLEILSTNIEQFFLVVIGMYIVCK